MLKKIVGIIWRKTPSLVRRKFVRVTQDKFTVSAGAVISDKDGRILLLNHVFRTASGWGIPGGFIKHNEQPIEALKRELCEETGLELNNVKLIAARTANKHIEMIFRAEADGEVTAKNFEIKNAGWFEITDMPKEMDEMQKINIRTILAQN